MDINYSLANIAPVISCFKIQYRLACIHFEDEPQPVSGMIDLLGRDAHSTAALHDGHVSVAPELDVFNPGVV